MIDLGIGAGISGALSLIGTNMTNQANREAAERQMAFQASQTLQQNEFSAQQAGINRDWQANQAQVTRDWEAKMSNSAYQRASADMYAAGLNPVLALNRGGASTPNVGTPGGATASTPSPASGASWRAENALGQAAASALSTVTTMANARETVARAEQSGAMIPAIEATTALDVQRKAESAANTALSLERARTEASEAATRGPLREAEIAAARASASASSAAAGLHGAQTSLVPLQASNIVQQTGAHSASAEASRAQAMLDKARAILEQYRAARQQAGFGEGHLAESMEALGRLFQGTTQQFQFRGTNPTRRPR